MKLVKATLALEFSTDRRSVAVVRGGKILSEAVQNLGRSTRVFSLIEEALAKSGVDRGEIGRIALGIGPGRYTGIRLAISVAQGWRLATGKIADPTQDSADALDALNTVDVVAVSSFEVLAAQFDGPVLLVSDAQRDEWAVARVEKRSCPEAPRLLTANEVKDLSVGTRVIGAEVVALLGVGETYFPSAGSLGIVGEKIRESVAPESLAPVYLRVAAFVKALPSRVIAGITD